MKTRVRRFSLPQPPSAGSRFAIAGIAVVVASLVGAAAAGACAVYDKSLLEPLPVATEAGGGGDAAPEASPELDAGCALATAPPKPSAPDGPDVATLVLAVDSLRLDDDATVDAGGDPLPEGLDLDGVCTCPGPESCTPPAQLSSTAQKARCDGDGGRDNAAGRLFATFAGLSPTFRATRLRESIRRGGATILLVLSHYNGTRNDPSVTVSAFLSPGIEDLRADGGAAVPRFDGTDRWTVSPASLIGGETLLGVDCDTQPTCLPLYADRDAYVNDGALVARLDFPVGVTEGFVLLIQSATVVGTLAGSGATTTLTKAQAAGRVSTKSILVGLGTLQDPFSSGYMCKNNPTYLNVKKTICASADVAADPRADRTAAPCDALAAAVGFSASPAHLGVVFAPTKKSNECDGATDQCP